MAVTTNWDIYYPTDYTADADVPKDMKDMADSIEAALNTLDNKIGDIETILYNINRGSGV